MVFASAPAQPDRVVSVSASTCTVKVPATTFARGANSKAKARLFAALALNIGTFACETAAAPDRTPLAFTGCKRR